MPKAEAKSSGMSGDSKIFAVVAYFFGILGGILVYLLKKQDAYARFHAVQSILLTVAVVVLSIVIGIVTLGLGSIIIGPVFLLLWLFMMYKAYSGEKYKLPFIGNYAEKYSA